MSLDAYDVGNGSVQLSWAQFTTVIPDTYQAYVDGILTTTGITGLTVTMSGYSGATPTTNPQSHVFHVTAVKTGAEIGRTNAVRVTFAPQSIPVVTLMKRPFPFPSVGPNG